MMDNGWWMVADDGYGDEWWMMGMYCEYGDG